MSRHAPRAIALALSTHLLACAPTPTARPVLQVAFSPRLTNAHLLLAIDAGDFEAEGLTVQVIRELGNSDTVPALDQGRIDVGAAGFSAGMINAMARGAQARIVAERGHSSATGCRASAVLGRRGLTAGGSLGTPASVKALRAACNPLSHNGQLMAEWLKGKGVPARDIRCQSPPDSMLPDLLERGDLDLAATGEPFLSQAVARGAEVLMTEDREGVPFAVLLFGRRVLRERDLGVRFMRGYQRGIARYLAGKTPDNLERLARITGLSQADIERACWPKVNQDGGVSAASLEPFIAWAHQQGHLDARPRAEDLVDATFAVEAASR